MNNIFHQYNHHKYFNINMNIKNIHHIIHHYHHHIIHINLQLSYPHNLVNKNFKLISNLMYYTPYKLLLYRMYIHLNININNYNIHHMALYYHHHIIHFQLLINHHILENMNVKLIPIQQYYINGIHLQYIMYIHLNIQKNIQNIHRIGHHFHHHIIHYQLRFSHHNMVNMYYLLDLLLILKFCINNIFHINKSNIMNHMNICN